MARLTIAGVLLGSLLSVLSVCHASETGGVRHRIDATVAIDPSSALIDPAGGESKGWLSFSARLSANSREARFYGTLTPAFKDLQIARGTTTLVAQTKLWEEQVCHQRRGLPKVTVTSVEGEFKRPAGKVHVFSTVRELGRPVPADDLTPGIKLLPGVDDVGSYYALRAQSRMTGLHVDLKIYSFDCGMAN